MTPVVRVPGDKSITHRTLLLAAVAKGRSRVDGLLASADTRSTAAVLTRLGVPVSVPADGSAVVIDGVGLRGLRQPADVLDCGNSGTTSRLLLGVLSAYDFAATLTGDDSLRARPMARVTEPLERGGARFRWLEQPGRLPLESLGGMNSPLTHTTARASAQVKGALLLAGVVAGVPVTVREPVASRDHSERMLRAMGVEVVATPGELHEVRLTPGGELAPLEFSVPGDVSSAAFFAAFAAAGGAGAAGLRLEGVGLNPTRTGFLDVLRRMGAAVDARVVTEAGGEPAGTIDVRGGELTAAVVAGAEVPSLIDELPLVAVLGACARGETVVRGADELRVKETDRIAALVANLRALGADAEELPDGFAVRGSARRLRGAVRAFGDHRIAMAFGVLGALPGNDIRVDDPDCVAVSYPGFWNELARVRSAETSA